MVQGPGFRVQGPGFRVYGVQGSRFKVNGLGFRVHGLQVNGAGFRIPGYGFSVGGVPRNVSIDTISRAGTAGARSARCLKDILRINVQGLGIRVEG